MAIACSSAYTILGGFGTTKLPSPHNGYLCSYVHQCCCSCHSLQPNGGVPKKGGRFEKQIYITFEMYLNVFKMKIYLYKKISRKEVIKL